MPDWLIKGVFNEAGAVAAILLVAVVVLWRAFNRKDKRVQEMQDQRVAEIEARIKVDAETSAALGKLTDAVNRQSDRMDDLWRKI